MILIYLIYNQLKQEEMSFTAEHYLNNFDFAPNALHKNFSILLDYDNKVINSYSNNKLQNSLQLKINNETHKKLCMKLLVHLSRFDFMIHFTIAELKNCERKYKNDMFMKQKKNILGFYIAIKNKKKEFAIKNFEEWKINSQNSSEEVLEYIEEGDLYEQGKTISFNSCLIGESLSLEEENTYLKIQEENKIQYNEMIGLINICNICGYWLII